MIIEIIVGVIISGGTLSVTAIVNALVESIAGIFRLGFSAVRGVVKAVRTFAKFVVKSIKDLIKGFQELLNFLKIPYGKHEDKIKDIYVVNYDIEGYTEPTPHFVAVDAETGEVLFTVTQHDYAEDWED